MVSFRMMTGSVKPREEEEERRNLVVERGRKD
jgi:hypothetical protein